MGAKWRLPPVALGGKNGMEKINLSIMGTKGKKTGVIILLLLIAAALAIRITVVNTHFENGDIKDKFCKTVNYDSNKNLLSFTIPEEIPEGYRFYLHVSGRNYMGDRSNGVSFHAFDDESQNYSWKTGKTYTYPLDSGNLDFCLLTFGLLDKTNQEHFYNIKIFPDGSKTIENEGKTTMHSQPMSATNLQIVDQVRINVSGCTGAAVDAKHLYLPVPGRGTLVLPLTGSDGAKAKTLTGKDILFSSMSHDGRSAACITSGGISLYDLRKRSLTSLIVNTDPVAGSNRSVFYTDPTWMPDDRSLLVTRDVERSLPVHGHETVSLDIYQVGLDGKIIKRITAGSDASITPNGTAIVFERDGKVMIRQVSTGEEKVIDDGRCPRVSPDGKFIAYVKNTLSGKQLTANAGVKYDIPDIWVFDINNFNDRRKLTKNYPHKYMDENEWLKSLPANYSIKQELTFSGAYDYYVQVWGPDTRSLYVLINSNIQEYMYLTRLNLGFKAPGEGDTARASGVARRAI